MIYYGLIALTWIVTVVLLTGKGGFLIAGYNTAPKKHKLRFDEKKLSMVYGIGMCVIAIFITITSLLENKTGEVLITFMPAVIIVTVIVTLLVGNLYCRKKPDEESVMDENAEEEKKSLRGYGSLIFVIVLLLLILPMLYLGEIHINYADEAVVVKVDGWKSKKIAYDEITSVTKLEEFSTGSRTGGLETAKLLAGNFHNSLLENYELYAYKKSKEYILLHTENKDIVIGFLQEDEADAFLCELDRLIEE